MCLHVAQSQWAVGGLSELFGDWLRAKRWRRIVMLMYLPPSRWEEALPMSWLTGPRPALLCLTRSGVGGGFAYSLNETSMKMTGRPSPNLGWHWAAWPTEQLTFAMQLGVHEATISLRKVLPVSSVKILRSNRSSFIIANGWTSE